MQKQVIYCSDLEALKVQLDADGHYEKDSNSYTLKHTLTRIKKKEIGGVVHSLCYVGNCVLNLDDYPMLQSLGDYEEMFADETAHNIYKSVYDYETPEVYTDEEGIEHTRTLPTKIGEFES